MLNTKKAFDELKSIHIADLPTPIHLSYKTGEYMNGYTPDCCHEILEKLHVAGYMRGWGELFDEYVQSQLGNEFTLGQVFDWVEPRVIKLEAQNAQKAAAEKQRVADLLSTAIRTGKPQILCQRQVDCNRRNLDCSCDTITDWIDQNGKITTERIHNY